MEPSSEVNLIPADLDGSSRKNDMEKCKHFSMRNYVSEMRQKDASKCWPFRLDNILSEVPKDILPSLDVPKYRWWKCRYCLPEFWVTATDTENGAVWDASCGKCKLPFADAASLGETATLAFNCQLTLNLDMAVAEESNLNVSAEISPNRCNTSFSITDRRDDPVQSCSKTIEDVHGNNGEREPADKSETRGLNFKESPALCCSGNGSLAADNAQNASKIVEVDKQAIDRKMTKECENEKLGLLDGFIGHGNESIAPELDQHDSPSSDSSEVVPHKSGSLHRRKSPKVRLLTELLAAVEDTSNNHIRKDNAPLLAMCDASRELRKQTVAEGEMADCENAKKVVLKKKRKLASEDFIMSSKHFRRNQEKGNPSILTGTVNYGDADLDSQTEDNERTRKMFSQTSMKSPLPERVDESMSKNKKKNHVFGRPSEKKAINAEIKHAFTSSHVDEFSSGELGTTLSPGREISKNICFFKEKNNLPPMRPDPVPALPQDTSGCSGHPAALTDKNVGENLPASVQHWSAKPSSVVNGTHLTLKTASNVSHGADKFFIPGTRQGPFFHGMEDVSREGSTAKGNTESRSMHVDPSFPSQNVSNAFRSNGVNGIISDGNNYIIPFLNERQRYASKMADQRCFWTQNLGILGASKKKKANKHREHSKVAQQCHDKSADPENPDDIPMEIVELMAKNQYERCLQDAGMDKIPVSRAKKGLDSEIVKIAKENSRREQNLLLDDSSQKREFHPQNGHTVMASKVFGSSAQKSFDISSDVISNNYKMNRMERYHMPSVRHTLFQDQEMPPCNFQTIGGPSNRCKIPNDAMNEDCSRIKALDGDFLSLGVSGHWYPPKRGEELVPQHSSIRPDFIPFVSSIMPQSSGLHSNRINFQPYCPRTPPKVEMNCSRDPKFFTSRANGLQKPEKDMNFEAHRDANMKNPLISRLNGMEHERRVASLDISSNETIPAMHLLSLMDAGMHSGKKIRLDENARLPKQSSLPCEHHMKEVWGLHLGLCKTCVPLRHPSFDYDHQARGPPGKYQELSAVCDFSLSASSSKPANAFRSGSVSELRVPLDVNDKGKEKCYEVGSTGVAPFLAGNFGMGSSYGFKPYHNMERNFPNSAKVRVISPYQRMSEMQKIEARNGMPATIQPPRSSPEVAVCTVNRNPAEFSVPELGNVYSMGRDDLKLVQRVRNKPELYKTSCRGGKKTAKPKHAAGTSQNQPQTV